MPEKNKNRDRTWILNFFIALLGILAPAAYLIGISFHKGTLSAYGICADAFPMSAQDSYVTAYYAIGFFLLSIGKMAMDLFHWIFSFQGMVWTGPLILFAVIFFFLLIKWPTVKKTKFLLKFTCFIKKIISYLHWKNNDFTKAVGITGVASYMFLLFCYFLIILTAFWIAIPITAYQKGKTIAEETRDDFISNGCYAKQGDMFSNCKTLTLSDGKLIYKGLLVFQTNDMVAFFTETGSYVSNIPNGAIIHGALEKKADDKQVQLDSRRSSVEDMLGKKQVRDN